VTAVRFLLDEHVDHAVALGLRRRGVEARTLHDLGRRALSDESHVEWAREHRWVIVTADDDYLRIASRTLHAGIVFYRDDRATIGTLIHGLERLAAEETLESMADSRRFV
jgi:hypothetical protein